MNILSMVRMVLSALARPKQHITIREIPTGKVLDVGGGGEGVIAQAGGAGVVAIDKYASEIHEARGKAPDTPWLVADATALPFKDKGFDAATAFFSCMYMPNEAKGPVFLETQRVLKPGGGFLIWDVPMAAKSKVFGIRLQVDLGETRAINTVYGVGAKEQSADGMCSLLQGAGFEAEIVTNERHWFLVRATKV